MTEETDKTERSSNPQGRNESVVMNPCDYPCEKCGSLDIHRGFIAKREKVPYEGYDRCKSKYGAGQCHSWSATRDHLHHHCRTCQYSWQTLPMKKRKAS